MIVLLPDTRADTTPVVAPMVATDGVPLLHVPPPISVSVDDEPTHAPATPDIADGNGLTVIGVVIVQPVPNE